MMRVFIHCAWGLESVFAPSGPETNDPGGVQCIRKKSSDESELEGETGGEREIY